ncbi:alpha-glucosidase maltase [Gryganskiella cystojenkinii]|nr:alpha-glucosidase maltase [Gryganskiella cystojenkinii]
MKQSSSIDTTSTKTTVIDTPPSSSTNGAVPPAVVFDTNHAADYRVAPSSLSTLHNHEIPLFKNTPTALDLELSRPASLPRKFGPDPSHLSLTLTAQSQTRLCLEIENRDKKAWRVPASIVPRLPASINKTDNDTLDYAIYWLDQGSFSLEIRRKSTGERLFGGQGMGLTMKDQFLELSTGIGSEHGEKEANLFGLGENVGRFRRQPGSVTTMWARDCPCNEGENLYGSHPFYMEVLPSGLAHGVLLMSTNGMDVLVNPTGDKLTYRVIGGSIELYLFTGPSPQNVVQQYTELIGRPCMLPLWSLGMGQCRWGYDTLHKVKTVVSEYRKHDLPLESMWIDIDYMKDYKCFTVDEDRFPLKEFREFVHDLHAHDQHLVMILDPGIKLQYTSGLYEPYDEGVAKDLFIKRRIKESERTLVDSKDYQAGDLVDFVGKVWPGKTTFPDWFHPEAQAYWTKYISEWYHKIPFSGLWIDMNENASFHDGDCSHIESSEDRPIQLSDFSAAELKETEDDDADVDEEDTSDEGVLVQPQLQQQPQHSTPVVVDKGSGLDEFEEHERSVREPASNQPIQPKLTIVHREHAYEEEHDPLGRQRHASVNPLPVYAFESTKGARPPVVYQNPNHPPYRINNNSQHADLEYRTVSADAIHHGGVSEYDAHNLSGHMEGIATYNALRTIEPTKKPFVLSRSTFVGSGRFVVKWLGDNWSRYSDMRASVAGLLNFQLFGISMVGADVGGFGDNATEELLIRWHQLGSFYPFIRNHNCIVNTAQEPYTSKVLTEVTRVYLDMRYRLLPFWYTLFYRSHQDGHMVCSPLWLLDPSDETLLKIDGQFLIGTSILVSPALEPEQEVVEVRFPSGRWYDLHSGLLEIFVPSDQGSQSHEIEAPLSKIPVHVRGGHILPRASIDGKATFKTTAQVKKAPLEVVAALDERGCAKGEYYHDDDAFESADGTMVKLNARPGVFTMAATRAASESVEEQSAPEQTDLTVPFPGPPGVRSAHVAAVTVWGVGMDSLTGGKIPEIQAGSSSKVDIHLVRVSIVSRPDPGSTTLQHQRELRAVPTEEIVVSWDAKSAQLRVEMVCPGGLEVRGDEALEIDWADALMA